MDNVIQRVATEFNSLMTGIRKDSLPAVDIEREKLFKLYMQPHRRYHTLKHVDDMLLKLSEAPVEDITAVKAAIFFHDAVYYPGSPYNEECSVNVLKTAELFLERSVVTKAARFILATKTHTPRTSDPDELIFLDLDLSILGASRRDYYSEYEVAIMDEYQWFDSEVYARKRVAFLQNLLSRERIFLSEWGFERYELNARKNIAWAIDAFKKSYGLLDNLLKN